MPYLRGRDQVSLKVKNPAVLYRTQTAGYFVSILLYLGCESVKEIFAQTTLNKK